MKRFEFSLNKLKGYKQQVLDREKNSLAHLRRQQQQYIDDKYALEQKLKQSNEEYILTTKFHDYSYMLDLDQIYNQFDHAVQYINNASRRKWKSNAADEMVKIYSGDQSIETGLANMQALADAYDK